MRLIASALLLGLVVGCKQQQVVVTVDHSDAWVMPNVVIDTSRMPAPTSKTDGITLEKRPGMERVIVRGRTPMVVRVIVEPLFDAREQVEVAPQPRPPATSATTQPVMPGRRTEP